MEVNFLFNAILLVLIITLIVIVIKQLFNLQALDKVGKQQYAILKIQLEKEKLKYVANSKKLSVVDELNKMLINNLFKITKDLLFMQKLIFDK